jgi:uncharacterized lipoprotein YddW (UPF0748 family)
MRIKISGCLLFVGFFLCANSQPLKNDKNVFEFRGVWIATVENIDYPSKRGLSNEAQKQEFIDLLDRHQQNGMNAIIMQNLTGLKFLLTWIITVTLRNLLHLA